MSKENEFLEKVIKTGIADFKSADLRVDLPLLVQYIQNSQALRSLSLPTGITSEQLKTLSPLLHEPSLRELTIHVEKMSLVMLKQLAGYMKKRYGLRSLSIIGIPSDISADEEKILLEAINYGGLEHLELHVNNSQNLELVLSKLRSNACLISLTLFYVQLHLGSLIEFLKDNPQLQLFKLSSYGNITLGDYQSLLAILQVSKAFKEFSIPPIDGNRAEKAQAEQAIGPLVFHNQILTMIANGEVETAKLLLADKSDGAGGLLQACEKIIAIREQLSAAIQANAWSDAVALLNNPQELTNFFARINNYQGLFAYFADLILKDPPKQLTFIASQRLALLMSQWDEAHLLMLLRRIYARSQAELIDLVKVDRLLTMQQWTQILFMARGCILRKRDSEQVALKKNDYAARDKKIRESVVENKHLNKKVIDELLADPDIKECLLGRYGTCNIAITELLLVENLLLPKTESTHHYKEKLGENPSAEQINQFLIKERDALLKNLAKPLLVIEKKPLANHTNDQTSEENEQVAAKKHSLSLTELAGVKSPIKNENGPEPGDKTKNVGSTSQQIKNDTLQMRLYTPKDTSLQEITPREDTNPFLHYLWLIPILLGCACFAYAGSLWAGLPLITFGFSILTVAVILSLAGTLLAATGTLGFIYANLNVPSVNEIEDGATSRLTNNHVSKNALEKVIESNKPLLAANPSTSKEETSFTNNLSYKLE